MLPYAPVYGILCPVCIGRQYAPIRPRTPPSIGYYAQYAPVRPRLWDTMPSTLPYVPVRLYAPYARTPPSMGYYALNTPRTPPNTG